MQTAFMGESTKSPIGTISLPKGGGALSGIGEKFAPNLHTGTGNFSVPIALPAGRNGFQPQLSLAYSTGNGNGPFGLGWTLSVPGVNRLTSKGIPRYQDGSETPDVFVLSAAEDLVPVEGTFPGRVRYRPRTEGLFARIVRHRDGGTDHWEVSSKDGLTSFYGTPQALGVDPAVVADPRRRDHVFAWKLTETRDTFGSRIVYEHQSDAGQNDMHHWDQSYLKRIRYIDYSEGGAERFLVSVEFHYGPRPDASSDHRAGFEIHTRLRCTRIETRVHHGGDRLVRRYDLQYLDERTDLADLASLLPLNGASLLSRIVVTGIGDDGVTEESLPPLEFGYSVFNPVGGNDLIEVTGVELPATSLADPTLELVDITGNGTPDILQMSDAARWWRNLGDGRFDLPRSMSEAPSRTIAEPGVLMLDADGDGRADLLIADGAQAGYFPMEHSASWDRSSFVPHRHAPSFDLKDPEVKLMDLDGDGITDALRSSSFLECWFNEGRDGWSTVRPVPRQRLSGFPNVSFSDPRVKTADMCGDGLQDMVLVDDGSVTYWPHQGHGDWGLPVHMRNGPRLPYGYDLKRVLIGDVDGDGLADLVYVDNGKVTVWINQGGNAWSNPIEITGTPVVTDADSIRLTDLMGSGVGGVLWSTNASITGRAQMFFLDLTGGGKPYLLTSMNNHMGSRTEVTYTSSSTFFNEDARKAGTRWRTTLPFPVHVVSGVLVEDAISQTRLRTAFTYHHGHWDGGEREFRGFGRVEQRDTEIALADGVPVQHVGPPLLTKTWFHVGPIGPAEGEWQELDLSNEYCTQDPVRFTQHPSIANLPMNNAVARRMKRDAVRTLRGSVLRTELYAEDASPLAARPYTVTESRYAVREVEPLADVNGRRRRIFFPHRLVQRTTQWERGDDPMTSLAFTDQYDSHGQPTRQTTVAMPRRTKRRTQVNGVALDERHVLVTHARTCYIDSPGPNSSPYIADRAIESERFELTAPPLAVESDPDDLLRIVRNQVDQAEDVHVYCMLGNGLRRIGHERHYYDGPAFTGLAHGRLGDHGALTRTESLVFTDAGLDAAYGQRRPAYLDGPAQLPVGAPAVTALSLGYRHATISGVKHYYADTLRQANDVQSGLPRGRGLTVAAQDAFGKETRLKHDAYSLLPVQVTDAAGLLTMADYDYRVMQPKRVTDPNGNASVMMYTPLGLPDRMYLEGSQGEGGTELAPEVMHVYDFQAFDTGADPVSVTTIQRVDHVKSARSDMTIRTTHYSDGFGRLVQSRMQAEDVVFGDPVFGNNVVPAVQGDTTADRQPIAGTRNVDANQPNVVINGWQRYDNKGRVIEKYEPFFGKGWAFDVLDAAPKGQAVRMFYDPRGQLIRTVNPDGSEQRIVFGVPHALSTPGDFDPTPWESYAYDGNDLAQVTHEPASGASLALRASTAHHFTPASSVIDAMGRTLASVQRDGANEATWILTRSSYDVRGNLLTITDGLGRQAFRHVHDLMDRPLSVDSIDAGLRTTVLNSLGAPVEYRDSKGAVAIREYRDALNRLTHVWAQDDAASACTLRERLEYGDGGRATQPAAARNAARTLNQLGKLAQHDDEAGRCLYPAYDFKSNPTEKVRKTISDAAMAADWAPDWSAAGADAALDAVEYRTSTRFDALNRPIDIRYPADVNGHRALLEPTYNRAGTLEQVKLDGVPYVERLAYNARGQRTLLAYGNRMVTRHAYDARTFRLARMRTEPCAQPDSLTYAPQGGDLQLRQDLSYAYDLVGNILSIDERVKDCGVQGTVDGVDRMVRRFEYDPFYRLARATGREADVPAPSPPWALAGYSNDPARTRLYDESYTYDRAGNMLTMSHAGRATRTYSTETTSNRLLTMQAGTAPGYTYSHDANGNLITEATSRRFAWDHADRMKGFEEGPAGSAPTMRARYLYGADGMRVKKWVRKNESSATDESTTYVGGVFEHHRWQDGGAKQNNHLHVMDGQNRIAIVRVGTRHREDGGEIVQYHLGDHLGGSAAVLGGADATANTFMNREEYTPYGETSFGSFARKRYKFSGKELDESGWSYFGARYYSASLARWIGVDPLVLVVNKATRNNQFAVQSNSFSFNRSSPMVCVDPDGLAPIPAADRELLNSLLQFYQEGIADADSSTVAREYREQIGFYYAAGLQGSPEANLNYSKYRMYLGREAEAYARSAFEKKHGVELTVKQVFDRKGWLTQMDVSVPERKLNIELKLTQAAKRFDQEGKHFGLSAEQGYKYAVAYGDGSFDYFSAKQVRQIAAEAGWTRKAIGMVSKAGAALLAFVTVKDVLSGDKTVGEGLAETAEGTIPGALTKAAIDNAPSAIETLGQTAKDNLTVFSQRQQQIESAAR